MIDMNTIAATQQLVIRRPISEVFRAFADPEITTKFWFNRSSGPLASGVSVKWYFDAHGVSAQVRMLEFEADERILIEWASPDGSDASTVEFTFEARSDDRTCVRIVNSGFAGDPDAVLAKALDSVGGFSLVLAAAKAWLEHGVELHIVADKC
jgi:uncharacterized protein YndB with AHSA1/START domain